MALNRTALAVHRHAWEIAYMLVGAGKLVEQGGLSAVLIACQRKGQQRSLRKGIFCLFKMILSTFAETRMIDSFPFYFGLLFFRVPDIFNLDFLRVCLPQGQLVTVDPKLHGIAHGGQVIQAGI